MVFNPAWIPTLIKVGSDIVGGDSGISKLFGIIPGLTNKDPDKDLWGEQVKQLTGNDPDGWGSGGDWSQWLQQKYGLDKSLADHYGGRIRQEQMSPNQVVAEITGSGSAGESGEEGFEAPAPTKLENDLSEFLSGQLGAGAEGVFAGDFGQEILGLLKSYLDPERDAVDIDRMLSQAAGIINPASEAKSRQMMNLMGATGKLAGGLPASIIGGVEDERSRALVSALQEIMNANESLKRTDIDKALAGFGLGADFLTNVLGESNKLVNTRGTLDSFGEERALSRYLGELRDSFSRDELGFKRYELESDRERKDAQAEDDIWKDIFDLGSDIFTKSDLFKTKKKSDTATETSGTKYQTSRPTTSLF